MPVKVGEIGAVLLERNDEWQLQHRYMQVETMSGLLTPEPEALSRHSPDAAGSQSFQRRIEILSVCFLTPDTVGPPNLPARERLSGPGSRWNPVNGPLSGCWSVLDA